MGENGTKEGRRGRLAGHPFAEVGGVWLLEEADPQLRFLQTHWNPLDPLAEDSRRWNRLKQFCSGFGS
jgi:hypothetical protein